MSANTSSLKTRFRCPLCGLHVARVSPLHFAHIMCTFSAPWPKLWRLSVMNHTFIFSTSIIPPFRSGKSDALIAARVAVGSKIFSKIKSDLSEEKKQQYKDIIEMVSV